MRLFVRISAFCVKKFGEIKNYSYICSRNKYIKTMVVSVWFGLILIILFTAGIIDEWKRGGSANKMSNREKAKYYRSESRRLKKELMEELEEIKKTRKRWEEYDRLRKNM